MSGVEASLEARIRGFCQHRQLVCYKFSSPGNRGVPDRLILGKGKVLFLEVKAPGNRPTPLQAREIERLNRHGIDANWCDNFEQAKILIAQVFGAE
jgi:hypothetical protein